VGRRRKREEAASADPCSRVKWDSVLMDLTKTKEENTIAYREGGLFMVEA